MPELPDLSEMPIPEGEYEAKIESSRALRKERKHTVILKWQIFYDGIPCALEIYYSVESDNKLSERIARQQLTQLGRMAGAIPLRETEQLHGARYRVHLSWRMANDIAYPDIRPLAFVGYDRDNDVPF